MCVETERREKEREKEKEKEKWGRIEKRGKVCASCVLLVEYSVQWWEEGVTRDQQFSRKNHRDIKSGMGTDGKPSRIRIGFFLGIESSPTST